MTNLCLAKDAADADNDEYQRNVKIGHLDSSERRLNRYICFLGEQSLSL